MELPPGAGDREAQMLANALRQTWTLQVKSIIAMTSNSTPICIYTHLAFYVVIDPSMVIHHASERFYGGVVDTPHA
jgi:hypothetical protein